MDDDDGDDLGSVSPAQRTAAINCHKNRDMIWLWQLYVIASLFVVWGFIAVIWARGGAGLESYESLRVMVYTVPGFMAVGFKWIVEGRGFKRTFPELGISWGRIRFWPLALAIPIAVVLVSHGVPLLAGLVRFDPSLSRLAEELAVADQQVPPDIWGFFWARFAFSATAGLLLFLPVAILTEVGFRAYPLELLSERFGPKISLILVGAFWAIALAPFLFLKNPYGSLYGIGVYLAFAWGWGVVMAWFYATTRTILAPALALIILDLLDESLSYILPGNSLVSGVEGLTGAVCLVCLGILALFLTKDIYIPPRKPGGRSSEKT